MIPFTQFMLPMGKARPVFVERGDEVERLALEFISRGGVFECEVLGTGEVSLTACVLEDDNGLVDIACELTKNGPSVPDAVDRLVHKAFDAMGQLLEERRCAVGDL